MLFWSILHVLKEQHTSRLICACHLMTFYHTACFSCLWKTNGKRERRALVFTEVQKWRKFNSLAPQCQVEVRAWLSFSSKFASQWSYWLLSVTSHYLTLHCKSHSKPLISPGHVLTWNILYWSSDIYLASGRQGWFFFFSFIVFFQYARLQITHQKMQQKWQAKSICFT